MSTARSRISKGRAFQKSIMLLIKQYFNLDDDDLRNPVGAENGPDVILNNKKTRDLVGLTIECKNQKSLSIWSALEQTKDNQKKYYPDTTPALIFHRSQMGNRDVWITVPLTHYLELRQKIDVDC